MQFARLLCSNVKSLPPLLTKGVSFSLFPHQPLFWPRLLGGGAPIFIFWPFPSAPLVGTSTIYAWNWKSRWSCAFHFGQKHSINKEDNSLSKNSFGLIRKLNCDRLAVVQFLAYRQSVSLFLESNYSQIIAKDQKLDQEIHRLKCRRKFSFVFHSQTKWNKSFRKSLMKGFYVV